MVLSSPSLLPSIAQTSSEKRFRPAYRSRIPFIPTKVSRWVLRLAKARWEHVPCLLRCHLWCKLIQERVKTYLQTTLQAKVKLTFHKKRNIMAITANKSGAWSLRPLKIPLAYILRTTSLVGRKYSPWGTPSSLYLIINWAARSLARPFQIVIYCFCIFNDNVQFPCLCIIMVMAYSSSLFYE